MKMNKLKNYFKKLDKKQLLTAIIILIAGVVIGLLVAPSGTQEEEHEHTEAEEGTIWTCSMHPQIRRPEPGQCPICGMDLIPLEAEGEVDAFDMVELSPAAKKIAMINTSPVRYGISENEILLSGRVKVDEEQVHSQTVNYRSRIEQLYVEYVGERVKKGQLIARVYSPEVVTAQEELLQAYQMRGRFPELYEAAINKLLYWEIPRSFIDRVIETGTVMELIPIYSEYSGAVVDQVVKEGQVVPDGGTLYMIGDLDHVWIKFDAYESDLPWIHAGDLVKFTVSTVPGKVFEGRVDYIDPFVDPQTRVAAVRVTARNPDNLLKPEAFVSGQIFADVPADDAAIVVPQSAVLWTGKRSVVYIEVPNVERPTYMMKEVVLGKALGDQYEILEGLELGQEIVTYGAFTIDAAAQLNNKASMMNKMVMMLAKQSPVEDYLDEEVHDFSAEINPEFKEDILALKEIYLPLKEAFIENEPIEVNRIAKKFIEALTDIDDENLSSTARAFWEEKDTYMKRHLNLMIDAENLEAKRKDFKFLSNILIKAYEAFGLEPELYVQYCPMADNNKGAYWISTEAKVQNPFMPEMPTCGEVVGKLGNYPEQKVQPAPQGSSGHNH